jgi:ribonuclease HII
MSFRYLIGIDEAGRGPLAGPVAVGAVLVPADFDFTPVKDARDSKQMTPEAREAVFSVMQQLQAESKLKFEVAFSTPQMIDGKGIVPAIRAALCRAIRKLGADPEECRVLLDGGLRAPRVFPMQETIIRGDDSEPVISLASIAAKVLRDKHMRRIASRYPSYSFEVHKGYGTKRHRDAIVAHGLCDIHRRSFCRVLTANMK